MRLTAGARWKCTNRECNSEIVVALSAKIEGTTNPRCCCGSVMKRPYVKPAFVEVKGTVDVKSLRRKFETVEE